MSFIKKIGNFILDKLVYLKARTDVESMRYVLNKNDLIDPELVDDLQELKRLKELMEKYRDDYNNRSTYPSLSNRDYDIYTFYRSYEYLLCVRLDKLLKKEMREARNEKKRR